MSYDLPTIDLTPEQKIWLKAVTEGFLNGSKLSTAELKIDLRREISPGFDPKSIDGRLLDPDRITPTLLGLWHVDPNNRLIGLTDQVIRFIRDEVLPTKVKSIKAAQAAERLNCSEQDIRLVFMLMQSVGSFWNSASGMPSDGVGYLEVGFKDDYVIDAYLSYQGLVEAIADKERKNLERDAQIKSQQAAMSSSLAYEKIYESLNSRPKYVNETRLQQLRELQPRDFDLTRLVRLIEELNVASAEGCYMSVAMLVRAIVDHIPPIFGKRSFNDVASDSQKPRSFREAMEHLQHGLRKVADHHLHVQIRSKEVLPNENQVDFRSALDLLLAEIVRLLK